MNRWKVAFFLSVTALVLSSGFWMYVLFDASVSYSYLHNSYDEQTRKVETLGNLIVAGSADYTKADIVHLLRQADPDGFIVEEEGRVIYAGLRFTFVEDRLTDVR